MASDMASHTLFDAFLEPAVAPNESHSCGADVVACRGSADGLVNQEIYRRANGLFGFRYVAWVAWRDAGSTPRDHSWRAIDADQALVTDDYATACQVAEGQRCWQGP